MVAAAKSAVLWIDWQRVRDGVHRRNEVAHDGILHVAQVCLADIAAVENQLLAWGIIDAP